MMAEHLMVASTRGDEQAAVMNNLKLRRLNELNSRLGEHPERPRFRHLSQRIRHRHRPRLQHLLIEIFLLQRREIGFQFLLFFRLRPLYTHQNILY